MYSFKVYPFNFYLRLAPDKVTKVNSILLNLLYILFLLNDISLYMLSDPTVELNMWVITRMSFMKYNYETPL